MVTLFSILAAPFYILTLFTSGWVSLGVWAPHEDLLLLKDTPPLLRIEVPCYCFPHNLH